MSGPLQNGKQWRDFLRNPGSIATCRQPEWLIEGCPKCDDQNKRWEITSDGWAYCEHCHWGTSIDFTYLTRFMADLAPDGKGGYTVTERERSYP